MNRVQPSADTNTDKNLLHHHNQEEEDEEEDVLTTSYHEQEEEDEEDELVKKAECANPPPSYDNDDLLGPNHWLYLPKDEFLTRFTRKNLDHSPGIYLYSNLYSSTMILCYLP